MFVMRVVDKLSTALAAAAGVMMLALIGVMIFEVTGRYAFNAPTMWAADLTYMLNGAIFMLAGAYCLQREGHIRIDFLVEGLPQRVRYGVYSTLFLLLVTPAVGAIANVAVARAVRSFQTGEVDPVSVFAPVIWPFHAAVALGLCVLTAQILVAAIRYALLAARPNG